MRAKKRVYRWRAPVCQGKGQGQRVVLVHGIWMTGFEMILLGQRLSACGFRPQRFRYASLKRTPAENAAELARYLLRQPQGEPLHLVAHSLGGIILLHLFDRFPDLPVGRVVMLGAPVRGSAVAARLSGIPGLEALLGHSIEQGLLGDAPAWSGGRDLGVIAGTSGIGMGRLIGGLEQPSDGTVAVAETRLSGATDFYTVPASHTGMLFSQAVVRAICHFLHMGRFS